MALARAGRLRGACFSLPARGVCFSLPKTRGQPKRFLLGTFPSDRIAAPGSFSVCQESPGKLKHTLQELNILFGER